MEIDIVNDILTLTVDRYILGMNNEPARNIVRMDTRHSAASSDHGSRLSQSSIVSTRDKTSMDHGSHNVSIDSISQSRHSQSGSQQPQLLQNCTVQDWLKHNAPILMLQSLKRLGLELETIEKLPLNNLSTSQLTDRKKKTKNELKNYDTKFEQAYRRLPNREEKEPMRPLYIYYKLLKQAMDAQEQQPNKANNAKSATDAMLEELVDLKNQRNELRTKLEAYQYDFIRRNNRRIKYRADIREVEEDYNLYKRLKDDIKTLEDNIRDQMDRR